MKLSKIVRVVFLVLFLVAVIPAVVITINDLLKIQEIQASIDQKTAENKQLQAKLLEANLKYRGYSESMKAMPDSLVLAEIEIWNAYQKKYTNETGFLARQEMENSRLLRNDERVRAELYDHLKRRLLLFGVPVLIFLAGLIIYTRLLAIRA
jgi:hypothetical protein